MEILNVHIAKVEKNVMPTIKKDYIDTNKVEYQFINLGFLGKDSIVGSRVEMQCKKLHLMNT